MMMNTLPPQAPRTPDSDLPDFLSARARHASDLRLAVDATLGLIAVLVPILWPFQLGFYSLTAGGCFLSFGVWGIADRELNELGARATRRQALLLRGAKVLATIVGAVSAAALMVGTMAALIGLVKS